MSDVVVSSGKKKNKGDGIIKDENGYYYVTLGAINTYNLQGVFYRVADLEMLTDPDSSVLGRRLKRGILIGENNHPTYSPNDGEEQIIKKTLALTEDNKAMHIKEVIFKNRGVSENGWNGLPIYDVYGWIKPAGRNADILTEALDNPDENVHFSIRSLVRESLVGATVVRDIVEISTWDKVDEGGVGTAGQWNAAGVESMKYEDMTTCVNGSCKTKLKELLSGNENNDCEGIECFLDKLDKGSSLLDW